MKAADFRYERPANLAQALHLLQDTDQDVMALAGGQSLMPMMNFRLAAPDVLVDLNDLEELRGVSRAGDHVRIGAMTRYAELAASDVIAANLPLVARALPEIAHSAIRNRGTIGGSVALADPAAEMPALLLALDGEIELANAQQTRSVMADEFFLGLYETDRQAEEIITAISVPVQQGQFGFHEIARRHGDYAMAGVALTVNQAVRIAFFGVSDKAVRAPQAEAILADDPTGIEEAINALDDIEFHGDLNGDGALKQRWAGVVLRRAWEGRQ